MQGCFTKFADYTHTTYNRLKYNVRKDEIEKFYADYCTRLSKGGTLYLIEYGPAPYPFVLDLDLKEGDTSVPTLYGLASSPEFWPWVKEALAEAACGFFETFDPNWLLWLTRPNSHCWHVHVDPVHRCFMNNDMSRTLIEVFKAHLKKTSKWEVPDAEWDKFVDASVYKGTGDKEWAQMRMLGSHGLRKGVQVPPYEISDADGPLTMEDLRKYSLYMYLDDPAMEDRQVSPLKQGVTLISKRKPKRGPKKRTQKKSRLDKIPPYNGNLDELRDVLRALPMRFCDDREQWLKIGLALRNSGVPISLYREWSMQSTKYTEGCEHQAYNAKIIGRPIKVGSVYGYLKEACPDKYCRVVGKNIPPFQDDPEFRFETIEEAASRVTSKEHVDMFFDRMVEYINRWYAKIYDGGLKILEQLPKCHDGQYYSTTPINDFLGLYEQLVVSLPCSKDSKKVHEIFKVWKRWKTIRVYKGTVFEPTSIANPNYYNTFVGYDIKGTDELPSAGLAKPFTNHIFETWARKNQDYYDYIINWFAFVIQKPGHRTNVALCVHGKKGLGKTVILDRIIGRIIGASYYCKMGVDNLLDNFNAIMSNKLLCFVDEMSVVKETKKNDTLKMLITDDTRVHNEKFRSKKIMQNSLNLFFASNHSNMVNAEEDSRRYAIFHSGAKRFEDNTEKWNYFTTLRSDETVMATARFLYDRDISDFNPSIIPETETLINNRLANSEYVISWWEEILNVGAMPLGNGKAEYIFDTDNGRVACVLIYQNFTKYIRTNYKSRGSIIEYTKGFWATMKEIHPSMKRDVRLYGKGSCPRAVEIPYLEDAKEEFRIYKQKKYGKWP